MPEEGIGPHYKWLWATLGLPEIELRTSGRAVSVLNLWPSFRPCCLFLEFTVSCDPSLFITSWTISACISNMFSVFPTLAEIHIRHFLAALSYLMPCLLTPPVLFSLECLLMLCLQVFLFPQNIFNLAMHFFLTRSFLLNCFMLLFTVSYVSFSVLSK